MKKSNQPVPKFGESDYMDLALIASIKRGDRLAFQKMYSKYVPILSRRFFKNFKSQDELKDVIMEIMMKTFENIHRYEMRYTFNSWITALARNYVVDYFRKKKKRASDLNSISLSAPLISETGESVVFDIPSDEPEVMTAKPEVERQAKLECIYNVIDRLPENSIRSFSKEIREMFTLYKTSEYSVRDMADLVQREYDKIRAMFLRGIKNNFVDYNGSVRDFCLSIRQDYENSPLRRRRVVGLYLMSRIEGWTLGQISRRQHIGVETITSNLSSVKSKYEQAEKEREIMNLYLKGNMPYDKIAKIMKMNISALKVTILRAKQNVMNSIDVRKSVIEISSKYTLEQLDSTRFMEFGSNQVAMKIR